MTQRVVAGVRPQWAWWWEKNVIGQARDLLYCDLTPWQPRAHSAVLSAPANTMRVTSCPLAPLWSSGGTAGGAEAATTSSRAVPCVRFWKRAAPLKPLRT
ncbi:hypothetical protein E2C01_087182 [Portunus trituberculatus]|uniref:Uncharacterized protein n=1 Tax=Portunus trituberculatus TaxID=210409 RepID=A0A5B7J5X6_PORTR|nr:hypothetical protein [Portunus trituberculatus]